MSFVIAFHRAASAEFIAASAWYENKRQGLALAFMAEIDRCVSQAAEQPFYMPLCIKTFAERLCATFLTAFIFA